MKYFNHIDTWKQGSIGIELKHIWGAIVWKREMIYSVYVQRGQKD